MSQSSSQGNTRKAYRDRDGRVFCNHMEDAIMLVTKKEGPNHGREFYKCGRSTDNCNIFVWRSEANKLPLAPATSTPPRQAAPSTPSTSRKRARENPPPYSPGLPKPSSQAAPTSFEDDDETQIASEDWPESDDNTLETPTKKQKTFSFAKTPSTASLAPTPSTSARTPAVSNDATEADDVFRAVQAQLSAYSTGMADLQNTIKKQAGKTKAAHHQAAFWKRRAELAEEDKRALEKRVETLQIVIDELRVRK